jgi:hypothetical protein
VVERDDRGIRVTVFGGRGKARPSSLWVGFGKYSVEAALGYQLSRWSKWRSGLC